MFENCVILFGGKSEERLVSVASGQNLSRQIPEASLVFIAQDGKIYTPSLEELQHHAHPFTEAFCPKTAEIAKDLKSYIPKLKNKIIIIALHGTEGEDGTLQKLFEQNDVIYTGSRSDSSALAFDKAKTKEMARAAHLPVIPELIIQSASEHEKKQVEQLLLASKKIVLKPNANGSSVGLFICSQTIEFHLAWEKIKSNAVFPYLAEAFITGREITVGVAEKTNGTLYPLPCSEVQVNSDRQFDYEGKYLGKGVKELTPAPIDAQAAKQCQELALKAHALLGCRGYSRTDMILTEKGPFLLETNTLPGLSKASFIPQQLQAMGSDLRSFFAEQIAIAKK